MEEKVGPNRAGEEMGRNSMAEGCFIKLWCKCTARHKAKGEKGKILLTDIALAGLC